MKSFCKNCSFKSLIKQPTFNKNQNNPTCIDLIFTNESSHFENAHVSETGLFNFYLMTLTVMGNGFKNFRKEA